jgi:2-dehydropantoate 2-reductase
MRTLVYGAGAIGGYIGALLAQHGADVTLLARGATLAALQRDGIRVEWGQDGRVLQQPVQACGPGQAKGRFDLVIVTLKSMQLAAAAQEIRALTAEGGSVLMIQNGLPWWYFDRVPSPWQGTRLKSLEPEGELTAGFDLDRVVGAVIYKPVMVQAPGRLFVPASPANRLVIGEVDNASTQRLADIAGLVTPSGLPVETTRDIRAAKWAKLMMNVVWNPFGTLVQAPAGYIAEYGPTADVARSLFAEASAIAAAVGVRVNFDPESDLRRQLGNHTQQTSMMQDARAGRPLEWEAIVGVVLELAALTKTPAPSLNFIAACIGLIDQRIRADKVAIRPVPLNTEDKQ